MKEERVAGDDSSLRGGRKRVKEGVKEERGRGRRKEMGKGGKRKRGRFVIPELEI